MKFKVKVLSPLHIGNGSKISPMEYVVDKQFHRIDMDSFFRDEQFKMDDFIENAKFGSFYLGDFYGDVAKKHILYSLDVTDFSAKVFEKSRSEVMEYIKTGGNAYIPGTSIKGGIRTALMWYILKENENLYSEMERYLYGIISRDKKPPSKKSVDNQIEKKVFGDDPKNDLLKVFHISDSNAINPENLRIETVNILTTRREGYGWKNYNTLIEALKIGTTLEVDIKVDDFFASSKVSEELRFKDKIEYLKKFGEICNEYARDFIDYELNFFNEYNDGRLNNLIDFYENLYEEDGILLHISWGSGWHGMTIGRLIEEDILHRLRRIYKLGRRRNAPEYVEPFPKTRKIVFEDGKPKYPLGWIKLEEIE